MARDPLCGAFTEEKDQLLVLFTNLIFHSQLNYFHISQKINRAFVECSTVIINDFFHFHLWLHVDAVQNMDLYANVIRLENATAEAIVFV